MVGECGHSKGVFGTRCGGDVRKHAIISLLHGDGGTIMKRKWTILAVTVAAAAGIWGYSALQTQADSGGDPGSVSDPVVTKSYVDEQIKQQVQAAVAALKDTGGISTPSPTPSATPTSNGGSAAVASIKLEAGQTLFLDAGADLIVRTGKVLAVSTDTNGIPDVTSGKDILPGAAVDTNHLLVFPREGRGVKPDPKSKEDIYVVIRGGYEIK